MTPANGIVEIRTLADLLSLFEIAADRTLTKEQYRKPVRPYRLIKAEASCQYQKNGKHCGQMHQHGYVVECHDEAKVMIGNCCALNHLGLDDDKVRSDLLALSAGERQNIRRHRVETLLQERESFIKRVRTANIKHRVLQDRINYVLEALPQLVGDILLDRWKRNALEVIWEYQIVKTSKEKDDENERSEKTYTERRWYPHSFGKLKGLGAWLQLQQQGYQERLLALRRQLEAIPTKPKLSQAELADAETVLNQMSSLAVIERELESQGRLLDEFLTQGNLLLTIPLVKSQQVQAETVKAVYQLLNEPCPSSPEKYVAELEVAIKQRYSSNSIRIAT